MHSIINDIFRKLDYLGMGELLLAMKAFKENPGKWDLEVLNQNDIIHLDNWLLGEF